MKSLLVILLIVFGSIAIYDASALCIDPHCYAITTTGTTTIGSNYQGLQYNIEIPDLYIDEQACEEMGAVVTGWIYLQQSDLGESQWIENGVTVGWIDQDGGYCVTTESAYYAYSLARGQAERVYVEDITDPHGDTIGIEKRFAIEKNESGLWDLYYGDLAGLGDPIAPSPLDFGSDLATGIDIGAEGTISPVSQYSTIPSTRITEAQIKNDNVWTDIPTNTQTRETPNEGYKIDVCHPGTIGAGAATSVDCSVIPVPNTSPSHTTTTTHSTRGTPLIIPLTANDADNDYLQYFLQSHPTTNDGAGTLNHVNLLQKIPNTGDTNSELLFTPVREGLTSFDYSVTDGRTGHSATNTITIDIQSLDDTSTPDIFSDTFENGLGFWITVNSR